jgi:type IV secretion system protein VirB9
MSPRRLLLSGVALLAFGSATHASEIPAACDPDPRVRCLPYRPGQIIRVYLAPGSTTTLELPANEAVFHVAASDQQTITGKPATDAPNGPDGGQNKDPNLQIEVAGGAGSPTQFMSVKALRELDPQPLTVIARVAPDASGRTEYRQHVFEIVTRKGALTEDVPDTFFAVKITDPKGEAKANAWTYHLLHANDPPRPSRADMRQIRMEEEQTRVANDRLEQPVVQAAAHNVNYVGQATSPNRAALAPSEIWDDGERTYLRYPGNRKVPVVWQVMPDGKEGVVGQSTDPDPSTNGNLLVVQGVVPMIRLRSGDAVLCIMNRGYDATGRNTGTGTVDPGVRRLLKEAPRG